MLGLVFYGLLGSFSIGFGELIVLSALGSMFLIVGGSEAFLGKVSHLWETDMLSMSLIVLSFWVMSLCVCSMVSLKSSSVSERVYGAASSFLLLFLVISFSVTSVVYFYVSFECCAVLVLMLILGWGYQPERVKAGLYLFFYTLLGSFPFLGLTLYFSLMGYSKLSSPFFFDSWLFYVMMFLAFLVKFPIYGVHLWLLKAHVEAPVGCSMILGGVLLKLGGYGIIRLLMHWEGVLGSLVEVIIIYCLVGSVLLSISCLRMVDVKLLIASSSVVHMGCCAAGLLVMSETGVKSCILMMIGHGLCCSGLFYLVGVVYSRTMSRSLLISKGLLNLMPSMGLWWFLMCSLNMSAPPSINLISEMLLFVSILGFDKSLMVCMGGLSFFSGAYSLYAFSLSQHGVYFKGGPGFSSGFLLEYLTCVMHWLPANLFVLYMFIV